MIRFRWKTPRGWTRWKHGYWNDVLAAMKERGTVWFQVPDFVEMFDDEYTD